jgi:hypothetical protein
LKMLEYFMVICKNYSYLVYFMAIRYCCGSWYIFPPFLYIVSRKIWQPCSTLFAREQHSIEKDGDCATASQQAVADDRI